MSSGKICFWLFRLIDLVYIKVFRCLIAEMASAFTAGSAAAWTASGVARSKKFLSQRRSDFVTAHRYPRVVSMLANGLHRESVGRDLRAGLVLLTSDQCGQSACCPPASTQPEVPSVPASTEKPSQEANCLSVTRRELVAHCCHRRIAASRFRGPPTQQGRSLRLSPEQNG